MVNRLVSVGDDFTLPVAVKAADANLPARLQDGALNATYALKGEGGGEVFNATESSLRQARAAATKRRPFRLAFAGDSITKGAGSSADLSQYYYLSYTGLVRSMLAGRYGDAGTGIMYAMDTMFTNGEDPRWAFTGSWSAQLGGPMNNSLRRGTAGATATFTADADLFTIYYRTGPEEGTWQAEAGAAVQRVEAYDTVEGYASVTVPVPNGKRGTWPLVITALSGNTSFFGIEASIGSAGVRATMIGRGGAHISDLVQDATPTRSLSTVIEMGDFDLLCLFFGTNYQTVDSYKTDLTTAITRQRANGGDVLLIAPYDNAITGVAEPIEDFVAACYEVGQSLDVPVLDLYKRWGSYEIANAAPLKFYSDDRHPSALGTSDIASALYAFLTAYVLGDLPRATTQPAVQTVTVVERAETLFKDGTTPPEAITNEAQTDQLFTDK